MILEMNDLIVESIHKHPQLRYGQAVFGALFKLDREAALEITQTDLDPFEWERNDERLVAFWDWIYERYNEDECD